MLELICDEKSINDNFEIENVCRTSDTLSIESVTIKTNQGNIVVKIIRDAMFSANSAINLLMLLNDSNSNIKIDCYKKYLLITDENLDTVIKVSGYLDFEKSDIYC